MPTTTIQNTFAEQGYYVAKGVFSPDEVAELESEFDAIVHQLLSSGENVNARWSGPEMERMDAAATTILHTHNVQQYSAAWLRALIHPRFLAVAKEILGEDVVLHHSKLFQKPSEAGAPFPMHQDWTYFPTIEDTMIAGIIHVSNATDEMGCLRVVPGSHKLGRVAGTSGQQESDLLSKHPIQDAVPLEAEPGDVVFFSYFTLHGSMPNRSDKVRKTVLVQMYAGNDAVEEGNTHPDEHLTLSGRNLRMTRAAANRLK